MRPEYIFRINVVYSKTANDIVEINSDDASNKKWGKAYITFKNNIRTHLKLQQRGRCAFCRCMISIGTSYSNLEHIICKDDYPKFKTEPLNLVYCCWLCNSSKLKKNTLTAPHPNKALQTLPTTSIDYNIINPYLDNYEDHIEFVDDIIITTKNGSIKGQNTIGYYGLTRPVLAEERAREFKLDQLAINNRLLQQLTDPTTPADILNQIKGIIDQLPSWTV